MDIQFVISGDGEFGPRWRQLAAGLDNVVFTGWIGAHEINWLRAHAAVGLQPYAQGAPQGLANKLFEYLHAGLPIVASDATATVDFLRRYGLGEVAALDDAAGWARAIDRALRPPPVPRGSRPSPDRCRRPRPVR